MKDLIINVGLLLLGCMIFEMIAGDGESLRAASGMQMERIFRLTQR